jgi:hypothetical protein
MHLPKSYEHGCSIHLKIPGQGGRQTVIMQFDFALLARAEIDTIATYAE